MVVNDVVIEISQVFFAHRAEQTESQLAFGLRLPREETLHSGVVAAAHLDVGTHDGEVEMAFLAETGRGGGVGEGGHIGGADAVFISLPHIVTAGRLVAHLRKIVVLHRGRQVEINRKCVTFFMTEFHGHHRVAPNMQGSESVATVFGGPGHEVAKARHNAGFAVGIAARVHHGEKVGIVIEFEIDGSVAHRLSFSSTTRTRPFATGA